MPISKAFCLTSFAGTLLFVSSVSAKAAISNKKVPNQKLLITRLQDRDTARQKEQLNKLMHLSKNPHVKVTAFYVTWDEASFTSLKNNLDKIDILIPEWLNLKDAQGNFDINDLNNPKPVTELIKQNSKLAVMPLISNFSITKQDWEGQWLKKLLNNPANSKKLIKALVVLLKNNNFQGINIDFETVPGESQQKLIRFMKELYTEFHKVGLKVSQDVPLDDNEFNYKAFAKYNDYLILMAYDQHWSTGVAGPVASQAWFREKIKKRLKQLNPQKTIIAIGNYGYDWTGTTKTAETLSIAQIKSLVTKNKAKIRFNKTILNPSFGYYGKDKKLHHVWYLDSTTAYNQMVEAIPYNYAGFALWRLGSEDSDLWKFFNF